LGVSNLVAVPAIEFGRYVRDEVAFLVALPVFSATRNSTIRRIRSVGIGPLRGNWTEPFPPLYALSSALNASIPVGTC